MRRVVTPELLDSDAGTAPEIEAALLDLRRINRWFGGVSTTASLLRHVAERTGKDELTVLDVGAGPGQALLTSRQMLAREGLTLRVTLLDRAATHLPRNGVRILVGDALALPFTANSFDVVTSSLFVHHLEPDEVVAHMNEALRVCRIAAMINDLQRSATHLALVYAGLPLFHRITRHDALASVRRAYTESEMRDMLVRTRANGVKTVRHFLFRIGAIAWKAQHA
jgi:ubiquinone/menaquinone biosynthesis C-methylase UbiE